MSARRPVVIAPSILSADFARLGTEVRAAQDAGAGWIHVDVMDGHFVPNITLGPLVADAVRRSCDLPMDVHLMVENPERHVEAFVAAGARSMSVHVEATVHIHRVLGSIQRLGVMAGVAVNPGTPLTAIEPVLDVADLIVLMAVNPGWGGQPFIAATAGRTRELRRLLDARRLSTLIEIDGGVNGDTTAEVVRAGADVLVAGSYVFEHPDGIEAAIARLREQVETALSVGPI